MTNAWTYRRADRDDIVELASWRGAGSLGLRPHFHDEHQLVLVLSGSRSFRIEGETITVPAGHAALIPAGMLHAPMPTSDEETACLNAYVPASRACSSLQVVSIGARWQRVDEISPEHILEIAGDILSRAPSASTGRTDRSELGAALTESLAPIGAVAAGLGRSREGFSRMVRRELGVAPHAPQIQSMTIGQQKTAALPSTAASGAVLGLACVYGGFFGAGLGVILTAVLSVTEPNDIRAIKALKNLLATCVSLAATLIFIVQGAVRWPETLAMLLGAVAGGYAGGHLIRVLPAPVVRQFVIVAGAVMTVIYAARYWF
ncbi:AraC-like protein [Bradyrhizobium macuxiense]|uniref:Probable membrane transporter protein n=2 Tax=Bradyrhizobium macuxiense TaxID=1755647 RepID=A0A560MC63_9BRAD|nr:AraC-like protein [Bradyrhizobium macuxiense]